MGIVNVDFGTKQIVEAPLYTMEQVEQAIAVLEGFITDNLIEKENNISNALQILLHDIEDATDEEIAADPLRTVQRIRSLRQKRRDIKNLKELQAKVKKNFTPGTVKDAIVKLEQHSEKVERGSSDEFYKNCLQRKTLTNKSLIRSSRLLKEHDEDGNETLPL